MCHGHPHFHKCQHTSVKWLYCPEGAFDPVTGYESPCSNPIYSTPQPSNADCPLQNCHYKSLRGSWTCCQCGHNANSQGWCDGKDPRLGKQPYSSVIYEEYEGYEPGWQACGHGCCSKCVKNDSESPSHESAFTDLRKGKHRSRRAHNYEFITTIPPVPGCSSSSSSAGSQFGIDIAHYKAKSSSGKKKPQRRTHRH